MNKFKQIEINPAMLLKLQGRAFTVFWNMSSLREIAKASVVDGHGWASVKEALETSNETTTDAAFKNTIITSSRKLRSKKGSNKTSCSGII